MAHGAILGQKLEMDDYLRTDGTNAMTGNLNMTDQGIIDVTLLSSQASMQLNTTSDSDSFTLSIVKGTTNPNRIVLTNNVTTFSRPIAMNNNKIIGLADGTADTDAATVGQLNAAVASSGPQYAHPTGNTNFDFHDLFLIAQRSINRNTQITTAESQCFSAAYTYIYREPRNEDYLIIKPVNYSNDMILEYIQGRWRIHPTALDSILSGTVWVIGGRTEIR